MKKKKIRKQNMRGCKNMMKMNRGNEGVNERKVKE